MNDLNIKFIKAMKKYRERRDHPEELLELINRRRRINSNRGVRHKRVELSTSTVNLQDTIRKNIARLLSDMKR